MNNKAIWDFQKSTVYIARQPHLLRFKGNRGRWCRRVVIHEEIAVPPRFEVIVPAQVQFRRMPSLPDNGDWGTEPTCTQNGLHVSRTLIPRGFLNDVPVVEESSPVTGETTKPKQIVSEDDDLPDYIQKLLDDVDVSIFLSLPA